MERSMDFKTMHAMLVYLGYLYKRQYVHKKPQECEQAEDFINYIDKGLLCLKKEYRELLRTEYFSFEEEQSYLSYYSRSGYYNIKRKAMESFLHCLM